MAARLDAYLRFPAARAFTRGAAKTVAEGVRGRSRHQAGALSPWSALLLTFLAVRAPRPIRATKKCTCHVVGLACFCPICIYTHMHTHLFKNGNGGRGSRAASQTHWGRGTRSTHSWPGSGLPLMWLADRLPLPVEARIPAWPGPSSAGEIGPKSEKGSPTIRQEPVSQGPPRFGDTCWHSGQACKWHGEGLGARAPCQGHDIFGHDSDSVLQRQAELLVSIRTHENPNVRPSSVDVMPQDFEGRFGHSMVLTV